MNYPALKDGACAAIVPPAGPLAQAALIHTCKCRV